MKTASLSMPPMLEFWRGLSTLQMALGLSIAFHAALLMVKFVDPTRFENFFLDNQLEVVLVNARTDERPQQVQALAQANLAGGGDLDKGLASSPLPPTLLSSKGDTFDEEQRRQDTLQAQQNLMVAQIKEQLVRMAALPQATGNSSEAANREEKRRQLMQLLAEIEKRIQEQNARPKKRYISPATREVPYAMYYDQLRRRIEEKGTENFPELDGKKLYGELIMSLTVDSQGRVLNAVVEQSSGNGTLDRRALAIAKSASPFGQFSEGMSRAEHIVVVSQFKFTRDETLETKLMSSQSQ